MKQSIKHLALLILLTIFGCTKNHEFAPTPMQHKETVAPVAQQNVSQVAERKLIKEGRVEFESTSLNATRETIFEAINRYNGYISSDQERNLPGRKSNTIIIRVPANDFDNLLIDATQGVDKFESKAIDIKDVTEEFLDVEARLKTKKELEQRFIELLKEAKNVTEILEIEKQIGLLRSDIESIEGRLKYLQDQVSYSTLTMTFYERIPNETEFGLKFKNGLNNGWGNLIWFFVLLTNIWPFILIGFGLLFGIRIYRRKK